jgi:hypothetical protein
MATNTYRTYDNRQYAVVGDDHEDDDHEDRFLDPSKTMKGLQASSGGLGFVVGILMQLSSLGISSVVKSFVNRDFMQKIEILLPFSYSFIAMVLVLTVLSLLRNLVSTTYRYSNKSQPQDDDILKGMLQQMESRFVKGALCGLTSAWIATDLILRIHLQVTIAMAVLVLALLCCYAFGSCAIRKQCRDKELEESKKECLLV